MTKTIEISRFTVLSQGVEFATVAGTEVERACRVLSTRPPYRDVEEAAFLSLEDDETEDFARDLADSSAQTWQLAEKINDALNGSIDAVLFSKTGAVVLRCVPDGSMSRLTDQAYEFISLLDNGNAQAIFEA